jgi:Tfp pilus assembly protein PilV
MSMSPATGIPPLGDEHGFSLIELLVAMIGATVVVAAALVIYVVALHQSTRITDRVQADQSGRRAMTQIVEELHSSCIQKELAPVQAKSTPSQLWFRDATSSEAQISSSKAKAEAFEDRIIWKNEALTDERLPSESGTLPKEFVFASTPSSKVLLATNVAETAEGGKSIPIFQYYKYAKKAESGGAETGVNALTPISLSSGEELGETRAKEVSAVTISFTAATRETNAYQSKQTVPFTNEVILAFGLPASESTIEQKPCQ